MPPGLTFFCVITLAREFMRAFRSGESTRYATLARHLGALALVPASFFAVVAPYVRTSHALYGEWFYNLGSTYAAWADTWEETVANERVLGDWRKWHLLPEAIRPTHSALGYLRTHSLGQIVVREVRGFFEIVGNVIIGHGYAEFVFIYLAFFAVAFEARRRTARGRPSVALPGRTPLFEIAFLSLYVALFSFYGPISANSRFILTLFLPALYTMLRRGAVTRPTVTVCGRTVTWKTLNEFTFVLLVLHVLFVLPQTIGRIYAGG